MFISTISSPNSQLPWQHQTRLNWYFSHGIKTLKCFQLLQTLSFGSDSTLTFRHVWPRTIMSFEHIQLSTIVWLGTHIEVANVSQRENNRKWEHICLEAQLPDMLALAILVYFVLPMKLLSGRLKQWPHMAGISTSNASIHIGPSQQFWGLIWDPTWQPKATQIITYNGSDACLLLSWFILKMFMAQGFKTCLQKTNSTFKWKAATSKQKTRW